MNVLNDEINYQSISNNMLLDQQIGFRSKRITESHLITLVAYKIWHVSFKTETN